MIKECIACSGKFDIVEDDKVFYDKFKVPAPTHCPECRQKRRMAWRNERNLYKRKCDLCEKAIISNHHDKTPFPVYCNRCWWSDKWDATDYGRDYDFSRPFFEQFKELLNTVPRLNLGTSNNENCDYVNYANYSKDCYLSYGLHHSEKCYYCWRTHDCMGCFDSSQLNQCQYCLECIDCDNCYELSFGQLCQGCSSSYLLYNCRSCNDCFLCCNLVRKKYCILNEQYTQSEYENKIKELRRQPLEILWQQFEELKRRHPHKNLNVINCKDCYGDYLINSDNCINAFSGKECQDCRYTFLTEKAKDCMDCDITGWPAELCYEGTSNGVNAFMNRFSSICWTCSNICYCDSCFNSGDLFGCIGAAGKHFCILNKQYSEEEYKELTEMAISHMRKTKEWGEFFPMEISPFQYEETIAQEYYPR